MTLSRDAWIALGLATLVVVLSLVPFHPLRSAEEMQDFWANFPSYSIEHPVWQTVLERMITLIPLGFIVGRLSARLSHLRLCLIFMLGSFFFCVLVELLQFPIDVRHPRSSDALLGMWCISLGFLLALRLNGTPPKSVKALALISVLWPGLLALGAWGIGPLTTNWSLTYPVLLGDEYRGARPWSGEIGGVAVYPMGLDDRTIQRLAETPFSASSGPGLPRADALWVYAGDNAQGRVEHPLTFPASGAQQPDTLPPDLGARLAERVRHSQSVTIEVKLRSGAIEQGGPARIFTNSRSTWFRNVTVAQQGSGFDFRLRTFSSGANGTGFEIRTPPGSVTGRWQHVVATYRDGAATLFIDGQKAAGPIAYDSLMRIDGEPSAPALVALLSFISGMAMYGSCFFGRMRYAAGKRVEINAGAGAP